MSIATRALFTGSVPDASPRVASVLAAPDFFWNLVCDPIAVYHDGTTYCTGIQNDGDVRVVAFDHATLTAGTPVTVFSGDTSPSGNIHHSVAICRRASDGRLIVAYCEEGDDQVNVKISTNPDDVSAWGSTIGAGSGVFTYVTLYQLDDGSMYLLTAGIISSVFRLGYMKSTDGGATWSAFTSLLRTSSGDNIYWRCGLDGDRLHLFVTDTDRSDGDPSSLYHFIFEGDALHDSAGDAIAGSLPLQVTSGTLVQDDSFNAARPEGWAIIGGRPALLAKCSQTDRDPTVLRVCVWDGDSWVNTTVVTTAAPTFYSAMRKDDPYTVYLSILVGAKYEMHRYHSIDAGATWDVQPLDHGSGSENGAPDTPLDAGPAMRVIWGRGSGLADSDFVYGLMRSSF